ncbi:MAG: DNA-3-methyladenine glycosylase [Bdellovibrionales bacterium]|nr:DNA-3-methyladenine glycosylase [Bdellovibrionales bacterium]
MSKLKKSFFQRDTVTVAREVLGCILVRKDPFSGNLLKGRIVETEAYLGLEDPSCHSFNGRRTERTKTMYLTGGHAYIYFIYGMHYCFNIVTENTEKPEAVLIRALEPLKGLSNMRKNRNQQNRTNLTTGPAKLCQALNITKELNGASLESRNIFIESDVSKAIEPVETRRIGLSPTSDSFWWPLRFFLPNNPYVSLPEIK